MKQFRIVCLTAILLLAVSGICFADLTIIDGINVFNGNVGIGTTSPRASLDVIGSIYTNALSADSIGVNNIGVNGGITIGASHWYAEGGDYEAISTYGGFTVRGNSLNVYGLTVGAWSRLAPYCGLYVGGNSILSGSVGIGTTSPGYSLDVNGIIRGNNVSPSDVRLKQNIRTLDNSLENVTRLRGVSFEWKDTSRGAGRQIGLVAQEVEVVFPELVMTDAAGYKSVAYDKLVAVLIESTKELKSQNELLLNLLQQQQQELAELRGLVSSR